jgi:two-component system, response regulator FlrC
MRLMIIGQLEGYISSAGKIALQKGAKVIHCDDTDQALGALRNGKGADLVMIDVKQKIGPFIDALKMERIHVPVIACGIGTDARAAVKAIQDGAKEYVPLPPDADLIAGLLEAVTDDNNVMIGNDPAMKQIVSAADRVAPSDATVLITGESGTGKEVMSQYIHRKSKRNNGPFVPVNCAAIPDTLLESELFGYEKGAFTGATARRLGKFEEADKGTLLLDEITEMPMQLQSKLLRALQEREISRIGSNDRIKVDVRVIATSNRNMEDSIAKGEFREDLYYRLNVFGIHLPPLRERKSDLMNLAQHFLDKYAEKNDVAKKKLSDAARDKILNYHWRGNIRELENTMYRAVLISMQDEIEAEAIFIQGASTTTAPVQKHVEKSTASTDAPPVQNEGAVVNLIGRTIADVERDMIINTLEHCLGNRTHAANILGISIRTLRNKLAQYRDDGLDIPAG